MTSDLGKEKFVWLLDEVGKEVLLYLLRSKTFEKILRKINIEKNLVACDVGKLYGYVDDYHWESLESLQASTLQLIIEKSNCGILTLEQDTIDSLCRIINEHIIPTTLQNLIGEKVTSFKGTSKGKELSAINRRLIHRSNVETLDISALCTLLRILFHVEASKKPPEEGDTKEGDDVYRIRDCRNKLAHGESFDRCITWEQMSRVILRLGRYRTIFRDKIEKVTMRLSSDQLKLFYEQTMKEWEKEDQQTALALQEFQISHIKKLQEHTYTIGQTIQSSEKNIKTKIEESENKMEQHLDKLMERFEKNIRFATNEGNIHELLKEMKKEIMEQARSNFEEIAQSENEIDVQSEVLAKTSDIKNSIADLMRMSETTQDILKNVASPSPLCCWWDVDNTESLKIIKPSSQEYQNVVDELKKAEIPHNIVLRVTRIQNTALYQQYEAKKSQILRKNPPGFRSERFLWHRPKYSRIEEINVNGFSESNCGENKDVAYGNGISFLARPMVNAFTENTDTDGNQTIYMCSVMTGDFVKGQSQSAFPPRKPDSEAGDCYDSVVDDQDDPKVFAIFHGTQAYPHYLLTFK